MARKTKVEPAAIEKTRMQMTEALEPLPAPVREIGSSGIAATAMQEVQAAVLLARRFPRNEEEAYARIMRALKRPRLAKDAAYDYRRGSTRIYAASIYLMREMARCWGNVRYGFFIVDDGPQAVTLRAFAWDMETKMSNVQDAVVPRLLQRKQEDGSTKWVTPDARDMRELVNNIGARAVRNCIRAVMPSDFVEDALRQSEQTLKDDSSRDPDAVRKAIIVAFDDLHVSPAMLERFLGHPLAQASPSELTELRTIYKTIRDGEQTWLDYAPADKADQQSAQTTTASLAAAQALKEKLAQRSKGSSSGKPANGPCPKCGNSGGSEAPIKAKAQDGGRRLECTNCEHVWLVNLDAEGAPAAAKEHQPRLGEGF